VAGVDVLHEAARLRDRIGLAGQYAAVDENLTGFENLEMVGRLYHLGRRAARERADELLAAFDLADAGSRLARTYSGGMRRRLDLGASLVGRPLVLIMDEPSTGLDPRSRIELWSLIEELVGEGTTLLLTTQYLEEADRLADRVTVIDRGALIAEGTPDELKRRVGGDVLEVRAARAGDVERLVGLLADLGSGEPVADLREQRVTLPTSHHVATLLGAARAIADAGVEVSDLAVRRPTLDDVFLSLTAAHGAADRAAVGAAPVVVHRAEQAAA
jgi:ABC-type multidrug transport system ATPase subunit